MTNWNKQNILSFEIKGKFRKELVRFHLETGSTVKQLMAVATDWPALERWAESKGGFFDE